VKGCGAGTFRGRQAGRHTGQGAATEYRDLMGQWHSFVFRTLGSVAVLRGETEVSYDLLCCSGFVLCSVMLPAVCLSM
jgi:hypothetical protein